MAAHSLTQLVKVGTPTFFSAPHNTWSTIDLVLVSKGFLADSLIKCATAPGHGSDHCAVFAIFDVTVRHCDPPLRRNFRGADWKEFAAPLDAYFASHPLPPLPLTTREAVDAYADALTHGVVTVLEAFVPLSRPSSFTHRWWC
ncbi:hypothetical protein B0H11DRAFT_2218070 [Mycena galericulata]|nr:hypothetical protein B0H11DRAFT_2218070 [Mycena galericulata]